MRLRAKNTTHLSSTLKLSKGFNKLVNIILLIAKSEHKKLYLTRLLKILYIIDENSVKKIGSPITSLDYKVAEKGPLADLLWYCIQHNPEIFAEYFDVKFTDSKAGYSLAAKKQPDLNLLSVFEEKLILETVRKYKGWKTEDIIEELHGAGSLWHKIKVKHNLNFDDPEASSISKYVIDFGELIKDDDSKSEAFENYSSIKSMNALPA